MNKINYLELAEELGNKSGFECTYYNDNDGDSTAFEDDGWYHISRDGHRFSFDVVQDQHVPLTIQRKLVKLVDASL